MPLIKRYANRKLYDTESKRYITLDGIAEMIRREQEVKVIDHETGEDITALTQAQIIFEQERKLRSGIPRTVFTNIIQTGSDTLSQVWHAVVPPDEWKKALDTDIERRVQVLLQRNLISDDEGVRMLDLLLAESAAEAPKPDRAAPLSAPLSSLERLIKQRAPGQEQLETLTNQVEALTQEVERLTKLKLPHPTNKPPTAKK